MGLITQPSVCLSISPIMNVTMGSDAYIPNHYGEITSYNQRLLQIDVALKQLFSINCSKRHPGYSEDLVSIPGYKHAGTDAERMALKSIHAARVLENSLYNDQNIRWFYLDAKTHLDRLDRKSYTIEKYIALQELKVSCNWFISQYSSSIWKTATRLSVLELADLCKERGKGKDSAAPLYLLRSAELRIKVAQDFYDTEQAAQWLKQSIYDLTVMSRNASFWSKEIRVGESFYDRKVQLLTLAQAELEALKNPSLFRRIGNAFRQGNEWLDRWAVSII